MKQALGVKIFGISFIVLGLSVVFRMLATKTFTLEIKPTWGSELILPILAFLSTSTGVGLLMLQRWARWFTIICAGTALLSIVLSGLLFVFPLSLSDTVWWFFLIWNGLILWYFLRPGVKAQFIKAATSDKQQAT